MSRLLALLPLLAAACSSLPTAHVGPVTGIAVTGIAVTGDAAAGTVSCSQAGVLTAAGWMSPPFRSMAVAGDAARLLVGGGVPGERGEIALYNSAGLPTARRRLADDLVYSVALHPHRPLAAVGCADGSVQLVRTPDLVTVQRCTAHTAPCRAVRFSPDGRWLATAGLDGLVYLHRLTTDGTAPPPRVLKEHTAGVECLCFDGPRLYSGARDGKVRLHDAGSYVRTYQRLGGPVHALCSHGGQLYAGLANGRILRLDPDRATAHPAGRTGTLFALAGTAGGLLAGTADGLQGVTPH